MRIVFVMLHVCWITFVFGVEYEFNGVERAVCMCGWVGVLVHASM